MHLLLRHCYYVVHSTFLPKHCSELQSIQWILWLYSEGHQFRYKFQLNVKLICIYLHTSIGKSVKVGSGGSVRVYPYIEDNPTGPKQTHEKTMEHALKAVSTGSTVRPSVLYMHSLTINSVSDSWGSPNLYKE